MENIEYVIRKTKPKKGLPNGAWVCFNKSLSKNKQTFGKTPQKALKDYLDWDWEDKEYKGEVIAPSVT